MSTSHPSQNLKKKKKIPPAFPCKLHARQVSLSKPVVAQCCKAPSPYILVCCNPSPYNAGVLHPLAIQREAMTQRCSCPRPHARICLVFRSMPTHQPRLSNHTTGKPHHCQTTPLANHTACFTVQLQQPPHHHTSSSKHPPRALLMYGPSRT